LYGVEILTDDYFVLSQYKAVSLAISLSFYFFIWQTDGRTDRIETAIPCVALHAVAR